jgi:hypothetical protein
LEGVSGKATATPNLNFVILSRCFFGFGSSTPSFLSASHNNTHTMAHPPTITEDAAHEEANWAGPLVAALPELWALIAEHTTSLVGLHRLMGVCRASRAGVREKLGTLPGLVVCGG